MKSEDYINLKLKELRKKDSARDISDEEELKAEIFRLLMSKKFRKYSVNPEYLDHIRLAIGASINNNEPIKLTLVFGGYKLWRFKESPEVDWAELFSLIYYSNWLMPITSIYKPGVWFDFYSDDVILEIMDNISKEDSERYNQSFNRLLDFIKLYIPKNLNFTLNRVGDQYKNYDVFKKELFKNMEKIKKELNGFPKLTPEQIRLVELNVKLKPKQDKDPEWREKVFLIHEGYSIVSKRRPYYRTSDKIFVITKPIKDSIAVGTTKGSVVKFWIGIGALKSNEEDYNMLILSPKQLEQNNFKKEKINISGLNGKNFKEIRII